MEYDGHSRTQLLIALNTDTGAGAVENGNVIDTAGFESLEFALFTGQHGGGDFDMQLQESDTGAFAGEENVVAADDLIGTPTTLSAADKLTRVGYGGKKRYCRLTSLGINSPIAVITALAILGRPRSMPVADQ